MMKGKGALSDNRLTNFPSMISQCLLCPHRCADRNAAAFCGAGETPRCFRHRIEYGEETVIAPSHLFYLSGCNLRCRFCIGEERAVNAAMGQPMTPPFFAEAVAWGRSQGARTLQWVGGEPGIHIHAIRSLMEPIANLPPVVWKSNFYFFPQTFELLGDIVDTFIADLKFGNADCAKSLCGASDYVETVTTALLTVYRRNPRALIVRHLLLPGHFDCCFLPILDWLTQNIPEAAFSLRDGYLPAWQAKNDPLLNRWPDPREAAKATELISQRKLRTA